MQFCAKEEEYPSPCAGIDYNQDITKTMAKWSNIKEIFDEYVLFQIKYIRNILKYNLALNDNIDQDDIKFNRHNSIIFSEKYMSCKRNAGCMLPNTPLNYLSKYTEMIQQLMLVQNKTNTTTATATATTSSKNDGNNK